MHKQRNAFVYKENIYINRMNIEYTSKRAIGFGHTPFNLPLVLKPISHRPNSIRVHMKIMILLIQRLSKRIY